MEQNAFHTLNRPKSKIQDAVNDKLSGLIVGDSAPLSMKDLMLCQRTELHRDGEEKSLNVLREAIRPGTVIRFPITIDTSVCDITQERIEQAVKAFGEMYYKCFLKEFPKMQPPDAGTVWLGGGTGFATKTEVYPMFGKASGLERAMEIFRATGVPENHRHAKDRALGVSPHICKVTYWNGKRCQMGMCKMTFSPKKR